MKHKLLLAWLFLWGLLDYHALKCTASLTSRLTRRALKILCQELAFFFHIWGYFHLAAAPGTVGHDKIYRFRKFLTIISRNVEREYRLSRDISINETMVLHKGRLSFKQYIRNNPTRWDIKQWVLCEDETGYVYRFQVYLGKHKGNPETNVARRVVCGLTVREHDRNHHLYMDNFYCDPYLFKELLGKKTFLPVAQCDPTSKDVLMRLSSPSKGKET